MCRFCDQYRQMDYMEPSSYGFGSMGRYCDAGGFEYDAAGEQPLSRFGGPSIAKFGAKPKQTEDTKQVKLAEVTATKKKIKRRPTARLAKYGLKTKIKPTKPTRPKATAKSAT
ncbi:hypothetical protein AAMO2058_000533500 [Amorphochlora amoebiformis]